jgi:hypothetical protein
MKSTVYVETTVISYMAASPSRDIVVAAHQQLTRTWWQRRARFELFVSQAVVDEASRGDATVAKRRLALLDDVPVLALSGDVHEFAGRLLAAGAVPAKAALDALHIGVAALNRMEYLLTWNCAHIANASVRGKIEETCRRAGLRAPIICTPEELVEP